MAELSDTERLAIDGLQRLARRWPPSLTLLSTEGSLEVIHTADYHGYYDLTDDQREELVLATVHGIPSDGVAP